MSDEFLLTEIRRWPAASSGTIRGRREPACVAASASARLAPEGAGLLRLRHDAMGACVGTCVVGAPRSRQRDLQAVRGWRRFLAVTAPGVAVVIEVGTRRYAVTAARGGYIDVVLPADLTAGWASVQLSVEGCAPSTAPVRVLSDEAQTGIISDIDDTVMITALPRPFVALWNTFGRREAARRPVPGMAQMYRAIASDNPDSIVIYMSTGPWNVAPAIDGFLARHNYPPGPLLLTDWGPTPDRWFRSGRAHKRTELQRLLTELPQVSWVLVGDDGQHDPEMYRAVADATPDRVRAIAIRQLTTTQQLRTHGTAGPPDDDLPSPQRQVEVSGPDGFALIDAFRTSGALRSRLRR